MWPKVIVLFPRINNLVLYQAQRFINKAGSEFPHTNISQMPCNVPLIYLPQCLEIHHLAPMWKCETEEEAVQDAQTVTNHCLSYTIVKKKS